MFVVIVTAPLESDANTHAIERAVQRVAGDVKVQHRWVAGASRSLSDPRKRFEQSTLAPTGAEKLRATVHAWATQSAK